MAALQRQYLHGQGIDALNEPRLLLLNPWPQRGTPELVLDHSLTSTGSSMSFVVRNGNRFQVLLLMQLTLSLPQDGGHMASQRHHCGGITPETVRHFLLVCPHYQFERHRHFRRPLKRKAESLSYILSSHDALVHLIRYIHATKRFKTTSESARKLLPEGMRDFAQRLRNPERARNPLLFTDI
ncbi:hypothetical protein FPV67DRAFT_594 [Lyophyllum atratum]|nr:hypothetical protein FPV67DRAFT_594 [Lyophyllum atratum]